MRKLMAALIIAAFILPLSACGGEDKARQPEDQKRVLPYLA